MPMLPLLIRSSYLFAMAVWVGGFTFYGGVVVPILNDELDHLQAGGITRRVTDILNMVGLVTVSIWSVAAWTERGLGPTWVRRGGLALLGATSVLLVALIVLHRVMDIRLDAGRLPDFYPLHRMYLATSTAQWLANLGLIVASLLVWEDRRSPTFRFDPVDRHLLPARD